MAWLESLRLPILTGPGSVRTKMALCARRSRCVRTKMVRENRGVRTKITKIAGSVRVAFVRTESTWRFGQNGATRPAGVRTENRGAQKFGPKFTGVA
jgi:hypothetical protein